MVKAKEEYEQVLDKSKKAYEAAVNRLWQLKSSGQEITEDLAEQGKNTSRLII
jgi:hypothetical protein